MKEDHEPGRCYACGEDKPVRWKNLYTIGSEGTNLCIECEIQVVNFVRKMAILSVMARKEKFKEKRALQIEKNVII